MKSNHKQKTLHYSGRAVDVLDTFQNEAYVFLLESSIKNQKRGRYSFIGFDPFKILQFKYQKGKDNKREVQKAFQVLRENYRSYHGEDINSLSPFPYGLMGYFSYDFGLPMESILSGKRDDALVPDYFFGVYDTVITLDHYARKLIISSSGHPEKSPILRRQKAAGRIEDIEKKIAKHTSRKIPKKHTHNGKRLKDRLSISSNFSKSEYIRIVKKALDYIRQGDIYQVNLSQKFCLDVSKAHEDIKAFDIYKLLRQLSPSCFGGYFDCGDFQIISSSPERFLNLNGKDVETRPMKGTRPRGKNRIEDFHKREELLISPKEKAELLMIADLERNDLGRVCEFGSVELKNKRTLEKYKTVYQATATIKGKLEKEKDCFDLLHACFPGGSITGCPKIRAMQIIEELEPSVRSIYTGSMGYISFTGNMDFNILIRTLLLKNKKIHYHVGGGIVSDSTPADEYQETLVKAQAMQDCLERLYYPKV